jgi:hypothetical protein
LTVPDKIRIRFVVELVGQSPHGFVEIAARSDGGDPFWLGKEIRIKFQGPDIPDAPGSHFWIEIMPAKPLAALLDKRT